MSVTRCHFSLLSLLLTSQLLVSPLRAETPQPQQQQAQQHQAQQQQAATTAIVTQQKPLDSQAIDQLVQRAMTTFAVPGIAVAVVKDDQIIHAKGYGVRSLDSALPVDTSTRFGIASNSKAFTAAALSMLVAEKKLNWQDKVSRYIPEFQLADPWISANFTILDLLTHRSGLGLGAGDLMFFPDGSNFTTADVIRNLRHFPFEAGFRSKFEYNNNLYITAGVVIERVSGLSWDDFIEQKILTPVGMTNSAASLHRLKQQDNVAMRHVSIDGKVQQVSANPHPGFNAAGGIYSNIEDMTKWVRLLLNNGKFSAGAEAELLSAAQLHQLWSPQTLIELGPDPGPYRTHFAAYGLGWFLADVLGYQQVSHTGGLVGMVTQVTLIPELKLGIIVLTNQEQGAAFTAITNTIKDAYLGVPASDRIADLQQKRTKAQNAAAETVSAVWQQVAKQQRKRQQPALSAYAGRYQDPWFGELLLSEQQGKLHFSASRSPLLRGELSYYQGNTFVIKWQERSLNADAFISFTLDTQGQAQSFRMKAISPATDFSFDFHNLTPSRSETATVAKTQP